MFYACSQVLPLHISLNGCCFGAPCPSWPYAIKHKFIIMYAYYCMVRPRVPASSHLSLRPHSSDRHSAGLHSGWFSASLARLAARFHFCLFAAFLHCPQGRHHRGALADVSGGFVQPSGQQPLLYFPLPMHFSLTVCSDVRLQAVTYCGRSFLPHPKPSKGSFMSRQTVEL